jgi:hypothetical protein
MPLQGVLEGYQRGYPLCCIRPVGYQLGYQKIGSREFLLVPVRSVLECREMQPLTHVWRSMC